MDLFISSSRCLDIFKITIWESLSFASGILHFSGTQVGLLALVDNFLSWVLGCGFVLVSKYLVWEYL